MITLPEIAARIAWHFGTDEKALHSAIRGYRDKGIISHVGFAGRKALYDDSALARVAVLLALQQHGFEGVALTAIMALLNNENAPIVPNTPRRTGFARVVEGIRAGESWSLRFSTDGRKTFWGGCRIGGSDATLLDDGNLKSLLGCHVVTTVDLSSLIAPLLKGE